MATQKKVDVVTIGAGWTAAIMAWKLCSAGHRVVSLEQGPMRWANPDFNTRDKFDPLRYFTRHAMMVDLGKQTWTWRPNPRAPSLPLRRFNPGPFNPGQGLGGSAIHWTGQVWRFTPEDFKYRTHTIEKYGANRLPQGSTIQDWPVTYDELEPYYTAFDYDIGTSGQVGNLNGQIIAGGDPFTRMSRPYPNPPIAVSIPATMFAKATTDLGYHPFPHPTGILTQGYTDPFGNVRSGCLYCGYCTRYGCEVDAKSSPQTTHIPAALRTGKYDIRPNCHVLRINVGADGLATGVTYVDENGQEQVQPAEMVLVTGYTLSNVRMLLLSRDDAHHPNGIGNDRMRVGKNMTYQLVKDTTTGTWEGRKFNLFMGNGVTQHVLNDFAGDNFDHTNLDFVGGAQVYFGAGQRDPINTSTNFPYDSPLNSGGANLSWGRDFKESLRRDWDSVAAIQIQGESLPYEDQFYDLDPVYKDAWGQPLLRFTFDWHQNDYNLYRYMAARGREIVERMQPTRMHHTPELKPFETRSYQSTHMTGGAIMGTDPGNSVTNKYGQVWDTPNVFVTGAALYPQNPCLNPTGTLAPLAYMAGDAIRDRYFKDPSKMIS